MKKYLVLFLSLLLASANVVSCGTGTSGETDTSAPSTGAETAASAETETTRESYPDTL